jgi:hypothetical protein
MRCAPSTKRRDGAVQAWIGGCWNGREKSHGAVPTRDAIIRRADDFGLLASRLSSSSKVGDPVANMLTVITAC